ncbi:hypothetical protein E2C01_057550 [Portunus trituberculatus]|uniref:Uncharacterized protein n=1 Tax=Portunus trituberculatus TaxID=210409 RepID=A0A5B7GX91_PORTR|nr:hypothetical protein [Portunus trituberculatus]
MGQRLAVFFNSLYAQHSRYFYPLPPKAVRYKIEKKERQWTRVGIFSRVVWEVVSLCMILVRLSAVALLTKYLGRQRT